MKLIPPLAGLATARKTTTRQEARSRGRTHEKEVDNDVRQRELYDKQLEGRGGPEDGGRQAGKHAPHASNGELRQRTLIFPEEYTIKYAHTTAATAECVQARRRLSHTSFSRLSSVGYVTGASSRLATFPN